MEVDQSFDKHIQISDVRINPSNSNTTSIKGKIFKIEARDIILKPFKIPQEINVRDPMSQDFLEAYLSTPSFIKTLTDLSDDVMKYQTPKEKKHFLKKQLCQINKKLPAQVYIPFVSKAMRNYAVLNIAVEEAKIF